MEQAPKEMNGNKVEVQSATPYDRAVLGFRNYWYPACLSREVKERRPKAMLLLGDEVVFIGTQGEREITALDLAKCAGTIPYEILCNISTRVPRVTS